MTPNIPMPLAITDHNRKKKSARQAAIRAVKAGRLVKPTICSVCGGARGKIEAHHHDYDKPYDVTWLCAYCHQWVHNCEYHGARASFPAESYYYQPDYQHTRYR
jgi:hypothetical protein